MSRNRPPAKGDDDDDTTRPLNLAPTVSAPESMPLSRTEECCAIKSGWTTTTKKWADLCTSVVEFPLARGRISHPSTNSKGFTAKGLFSFFGKPMVCFMASAMIYRHSGASVFSMLVATLLVEFTRTTKAGERRETPEFRVLIHDTVIGFGDG